MAPPAQPLAPAPGLCGQPNSSREAQLRAACSGIVPLSARLEAWMLELFADRRLPAWVERYGSPLNVLCAAPLRRNLLGLQAVADARRLDFRACYAHKANKCSRLLDTIRDIDAGVDTASLSELTETLTAGVPPQRIICTAAIKNAELLAACVRHGVTVAIDNADELRALQAIAAAGREPAKVALRVSGFRGPDNDAKLCSRFGIDIQQLPAFVDRFGPPGHRNRVNIVGLHFHLHGGSAAQRVAAVNQLLPWIDRLRSQAHPISFLDIGGGLPINYQTSDSQWTRFWQEHDRALLGERDEITRGNHGLGRMAVQGRVHGRPNVYPLHDGPLQADWLASILDARVAGATTATSLAAALVDRGLQLRCEPGRSALDGCGVTVARVEYHKRHVDGYSLLGLAMNRTQCRTTDDELMVDPILLRNPQTSSSQAAQPVDNQPTEGYLVGATCTECESILLRRLRFPLGVARGDLLMFPNTAGYWMHMMESRSHQVPLAANLFVTPQGAELGLERRDALG